MKKSILATAAAALTFGAAIAAMATGPAFAHHAANAQFDTDRRVTINGAVFKKAMWINPHGMIFFDVTRDGKTEEWTFTTPGPGRLRQIGLTARNVLQVGQRFTLEYSPSRDGTNWGHLRIMTFPDGRVYRFDSLDPAALAK